MDSKTRPLIAVVGGGAAGFFAAISAARQALKSRVPVNVCIYESSNQCLKKVKISGGGRCNVTHHMFDIKSFSQNYPRGSRELLSPLHQFQAQDTVNWFKEMGIQLVAEADGRMFPESNSSQTIIDCFTDLARDLGVQVIRKSPVRSILKRESSYELEFKDESRIAAAAVLIATGSASRGYELAESLGHTITERAPSLFSFKIDDPLINDLPGLSFEKVALQLKIGAKVNFKQNGPMLVTHWGLSGPAVLKLSAWAAREMKGSDYQGQLLVNWMGGQSAEEIRQSLTLLREENAKSLVKNQPPAPLQKRFWLNFLKQNKIPEELTWAHVTKKQLNTFIQGLFQYPLAIEGQNRFKDEFVECGGVSLKEIDFKTMESKISKNLYFAGEILDVDGITGGFNFQNAWTTGWLAARAMVRSMGEKA